jgi:hypothetical protein
LRVVSLRSSMPRISYLEMLQKGRLLVHSLITLKGMTRSLIVRSHRLSNRRNLISLRYRSVEAPQGLYKQKTTMELRWGPHMESLCKSRQRTGPNLQSQRVREVRALWSKTIT